MAQNSEKSALSLYSTSQVMSILNSEEDWTLKFIIGESNCNLFWRRNQNVYNIIIYIIYLYIIYSGEETIVA